MNVALQGKSYPPVEFVVDPDRVQRFAAAVGDDVTFVPPTFVTVPEIAAGLAAAVADRDLGLDFARVVHSEQAYEWRRALRVGETLTAVSTIEDIRVKGATAFLTLRTELRDAGGDVILVATSTLIERREP